MTFKDYKCLSRQTFEESNYKLVPIRNMDRYLIMNWRNDQIYHLRQKNILTKEIQDQYFEKTISKLFDKEKPSQVLFSLLKENKCIAYGGLVHIDWENCHSEISLVMETKLESIEFKTIWETYLYLIEIVAFDQLKLNKIYTYAFNLRPNLFQVVESCGYNLEATLKNHIRHNSNFIDVIIHCKFFNKNFFLRRANINDEDQLFDWVNDMEVRKNSFNTGIISKEEHHLWFKKKMNSINTRIYILFFNNSPLGQIRFDRIDEFWEIDYSISNNFRGNKYGAKIIKMGILKFNKGSRFIAKVKNENIISAKLLKKLGFSVFKVFKHSKTFHFTN